MFVSFQTVKRVPLLISFGFGNRLLKNCLDCIFFSRKVRTCFFSKTPAGCLQLCSSTAKLELEGPTWPWSWALWCFITTEGVIKSKSKCFFFSFLNFHSDYEGGRKVLEALTCRNRKKRTLPFEEFIGL